MAGSGLHAHLRDARGTRRPPFELAAVAVEIGPQLLLGRILLADLADLAAHADRHIVGLQLADQGGELGRSPVVLALLLVDRRLGEVDEGGAVDVDVAIAGLDGRPAGGPDLLGHLLRVGCVLGRIELVVVPLNEHRAAPATGNGRGENARGVLGRSLVRVGLLAAGELEDERADITGIGRLENRRGHVEGLGAYVDRGDREAMDLALRPGHVEVVNAGRSAAERLRRFPDDPTCRLDRRFVLAERGGPGKIARHPVAQRRLVVDYEALPLDVGDAVQRPHDVRGVEFRTHA